MATKQVKCAHCKAIAYYNCGHCVSVGYCGLSCQSLDWSNHKSICKDKIGLAFTAGIILAVVIVTLFTLPWIYYDGYYYPPGWKRGKYYYYNKGFTKEQLEAMSEKERTELHESSPPSL
jgi:hypothetical protein